MKRNDEEKNFVTIEEIDMAKEMSLDIILRAVVRDREKQFFNNSKGYYRRYLSCDIPAYNSKVCKA